MKIAMIGAGSNTFAMRLLTDIVHTPELQDSTIALMDIDSERLALSTRFAQALVAQEGLPTRIQSTMERRAALEGADYVIIMILVGGLAVERDDIAIPFNYGIAQAVGDTLGPGGVVRFLRTAPVLLDLCREMEELCPQALLLNYTNPMAMNCWLMNAATSIRNVGLCHSVQGTAAQLAGYIGATEPELSYWVAGINHMAWYLHLTWQGKEVYPLLFEAMEDPAIYGRDPVRFEIMRHFGYFVTESSTHMSEYVPYFRRNAAEREAHSLRHTRDLDRRALSQAERPRQMQAQLDGGERLPFTSTHEYCARILHAIETNTPFRINGNVRNTGLITNLPADCVVEVPCLVDNTGVRPCYVGDLPPQLAALNRSNIAVQELAVQAALEGDFEAAVQAVALDPLTSSLLSLSQIRALVQDLLTAAGPWLSPKLRRAIPQKEAN